MEQKNYASDLLSRKVEEYSRKIAALKENCAQQLLAAGSKIEDLRFERQVNNEEETLIDVVNQIGFVFKYETVNKDNRLLMEVTATPLIKGKE